MRESKLIIHYNFFKGTMFIYVVYFYHNMLNLYHSYNILKMFYSLSILIIAICCKIPENNALVGFCKGLIFAWELYNNPK